MSSQETPVVPYADILYQFLKEVNGVYSGFYQGHLTEAQKKAELEDLERWLEETRRAWDLTSEWNGDAELLRRRRPHSIVH